MANYGGVSLDKLAKSIDKLPLTHEEKIAKIAKEVGIKLSVNLGIDYGIRQGVNAAGYGSSNQIHVDAANASLTKFRYALASYLLKVVQEVK